MQYFGEKPGLCLQEYDRQNVLIGDRQRIRKQYNRINASNKLRIRRIAQKTVKYAVSRHKKA